MYGIAQRAQRYFFCEFEDNDDNHYGVFGQVMDITNTMGCFITAVVFLVVMSNVMEGFVYQRIFAFMKR